MRTIPSSAPSSAPSVATEPAGALAADPATDRAAITGTIIAQFRDALRELKCLGGERMRRTGLSFANSHILGMLDRHGEMPMSRLAEQLDVSLSNASGVVDRLEERGLVERVRVPDDRRVVLVRVSDTGRAALAQAEVLHDELMQSILARLDDRRLRRVAAALVDVSEAAAAALVADPELRRHEHVHHLQHHAATPAVSPPSPPSAPASPA